MKLVLDVEIKDAKQNYIIRFNESANKWEAVSYADFNRKLYDEIIALRKVNAELQKEIDNIHSVLERHKKALQLLTKE